MPQSVLSNRDKRQNCISIIKDIVLPVLSQGKVDGTDQNIPKEMRNIGRHAPRPKTLFTPFPHKQQAPA